jgi:TIR domain
LIDLFLSYARPDRDWVNGLAEAIAGDGWRVWWDREIPPGSSFQRAISNALEEARCVTVIWSNAALHSDWVLAEASRGRDRNVLVPILKERVVVPVPFNLIQSVDLSDWRGEHEHTALGTIKSRYSAMLGEPDFFVIRGRGPPDQSVRQT